MRKRIYLSLFLLLTVMHVSGCRSSVYTKDHEAVEPTKVVSEVPTPTPEPTPEPAEEQYTKAERDQLADDLKSRRQAVEQQLSSLDVSEDSDGVKRYSEENALRKIKIGRDAYGIKDLEYEREYYFDDEGLYFARLSKDDAEMIFYFYEEKLIRWIDEKNNAYDTQEDHQEFQSYAIKLRSEANDLWNAFETELMILGSYAE